jgi:NADH-quinone oxidoreductase subunit N
MTIFMFSMAGVPPLGGFIGKLYVFKAALDAGDLAATAGVANAFYVAAGLGAVISVVSAFYYLRIIKVMYVDQPGLPLDRPAGIGLSGVVLISALFTVLFTFTFLVGPVVGWADAAAQSLVVR